MKPKGRARIIDEMSTRQLSVSKNQLEAMDDDQLIDFMLEELRESDEEVNRLNLENLDRGQQR